MVKHSYWLPLREVVPCHWRVQPPRICNTLVSKWRYLSVSLIFRFSSLNIWFSTHFWDRTEVSLLRSAIESTQISNNHIRSTTDKRIYIFSVLQNNNLYNKTAHLLSERRISALPAINGKRVWMGCEYESLNWLL